MSYDIVVIGAGIVGTTLARELASRFKKILLIEKERDIGFHTSSRNSGVIHSGFNPKPGTLKARLCVEGNFVLRRYCREHGVPFEEVGTLVVAPQEIDSTSLLKLKRQGEKNGVPGLEILSGQQLREREPNVLGEAALFSPTGAIVDSLALTQSLSKDAQARGVLVVVGQEVTHLKEGRECIALSTQKETYTAQLIINCAGLQCDRLAHMVGVGKQYTIVPFRGEYFVVKRPGPLLINSMIYPIPNPIIPFLGIHLTKTTEGSVLIGPNAVPAFGREAYRPKDYRCKDIATMLIHKGFWNALLHNRELFKIGWNELRNSYSKRHFLLEASRLVKGLTLDDLAVESRVGIRPQLIRSDGQLVEDLVIESTSRSIHILNMVSPGMTCALAFARWISQHVTDSLQWSTSPEVFV